MRIASKIICFALLLSSCGESVEQDTPVSEIDTTLYRSEQTTERFSIIIYEVDSFEDIMWDKVGNKIDSLVRRNRELERKEGRPATLPRVRVRDAEGNVRDYGNLEDIKKRLRKEKEN